tara:strand:+ start:370 stop:1737 length:1368 start_codon:yes stop_codon:yes gene_type:complete
MDFSEVDYKEMLETQVGNDPKSEHCKISSVISEQTDYNLDPPYQRGNVWEDSARGELIKSIIQNVCIPSIIVSKNLDNIYIVIDGKQRLTTLFKFVDNKFPLIWNDKNIYYSEAKNDTDYRFTKNQKKKFNQKSLVFCLYDNLDIEQQRSIFEKINYGVDLSDGEKLKGSNNKNVPTLTKLKNKYFSKFEDINRYFKNKRDSQYLLIAVVCSIITNNEKFGCIGKPIFKWINDKTTDITKLYDSLDKSFNQILENLKKLKVDVCKYVNIRNPRSTPLNTLNMINKSTFLMYIYALYKNPNCIKDLIQFSKYLLHVDKETLEIYSKDSNVYLSYKQVGAHGTHNNFYEDKYKSMIEILKNINKKNEFNVEKRAQIFGKTFPSDTTFICKICNEDVISIRNFHAAHIISRNNGGLRHIKNCIATCQKCNTSMGSTDIDVYLNKKNKPNLSNLNINLG